MSAAEGFERSFPAEMARLGLWYVRRLLATGEIREPDIAKALSGRVDIYRMTKLYDGKRDPALGHVVPEWDRFTRPLADLVRRSPADDTSGLERLGLEILRSVLDPNAQPYAPMGDRPFGCWTYEFVWEGYADRGGLWGKITNPARVRARVRRTLRLPRAPEQDAALHFANVLAPESPFRHMDQVAAGLRRLIADCRSRYPSVKRLWCGTWLNSYPRFQELFPAAWHNSAWVQPPGNFGNWWGQFQARTGEFNYRLAEQFRASGGQFPFPALLAHAPIGEIERHLQAKFPASAVSCKQ